jgi:HPt (histidine-containing phosphotransfer) domain-containing protein
VPQEGVDVSSLLELRALQRPGQPDVVARIVARFLEESEDRVRTLRQAVAANDSPAIERSAHALKGIAGTVGAHEVSQLALRLEQGGRHGRIQDAPELVNLLDSALGRARVIYERVLAEPGPAA